MRPPVPASHPLAAPCLLFAAALADDRTQGRPQRPGLMTGWRRRFETALPVLALLGALIAASPPSRAQETALPILAFDRPPYYVQQSARPPFSVQTGQASFAGLVADRARIALDAAGIPFVWVAMQPNGHLRTIEDSETPVCALGWFRKPEREAIGRFSAPIYTDQPQVILARADNRAVAGHDTVAGLLADPGLRLGVKLGYSLGGFLDELVATHDTPRSTVSQDDVGLVRMLLGSRFDYMIVAFEEAGLLIDQLGEAGKDLVAISLRDMPSGNTRHLLCSRATDPALIARLDAALAALPAETQ